MADNKPLAKKNINHTNPQISALNSYIRSLLYTLRNSCCFSLLFFGYSFPLLAQLTQLTITIPANAFPPLQAVDSAVYVAGSFNGWHPARPDHRLRRQADGSLSLTVDSLKVNEEIEYKFTRGDWSKVETTAKGDFLPNRRLLVKAGTKVTHTIENWEDKLRYPTTVSMYANKKGLITTEIFIPQLQRHRRVWVYLPPDYQWSAERYPVIYLQDGQNLFDNSTSFSGEWGVDETLNLLFAGGDKGAIVVGIDNGGKERLNEYSPWLNPKYGGGEGEAYMQFVVETLKPYVDSAFRTLPEREHTALGGSSMGGLISMYGGIKYQDVFGKLFIFSPSFWFSEECYKQVENWQKDLPQRVYFLCGRPEGKGTVETDMKQMYETLLEAGFPPENLQFVVKEDGQHSEWFWRREFAEAYKWVFEYEGDTVDYSVEEELPFVLHPIPFGDSLSISWKGFEPTFAFALFNSTGQNVLYLHHKGSLTLPTDRLDKGVYLLIIEAGGRGFRKKILRE